VRAVELALALMAAPRGLDAARAQPLPPDMLALLKAAAGDTETLAAEAARYRSGTDDVQEACATFVQQLLLVEGNDPFRVLGCAPGADDDQLRQHYRWLQRWLHPDRDPDGWVSVFADRVNAAWNVLKRPGERARARLRVEADLLAAERALPPPRQRPLFHEHLFPPPLVARRPWWWFLPHAAVGGSLLLAAAVFWADRRFEGVPAMPGGEVLVAPRAPPASPVAPVATPPAPVWPVSPPIARAVAASSPPAAIATVPAPASLPESVSAPASLPEPLPAPLFAPLPLLSSAPAALMEVAAPQVPPVSVLLAFRGAYQRGDTTGLMRLFTADAHTASGDWTQTRDDYAALFAATRERELVLYDIVWRPDGEGWVGEGRLDVRLRKHRGGFRQHYEGPFTVRLQPRAGTQRIVAWEQGDRG
jgi:hypothetical protein